MENRISPQLEATTGCIMDIFAANGFDCYGFFNSLDYDKNQVCGTLFESLQGMYTAKAGKVYEVGIKNEYMPKAQLAQIDEALQSDSGNKFLLINNMGSHVPFNFYNRAEARFTPADGGAVADSPQHNPDAALKVSNAYDNTLAYTDEYIRDLIGKMSGKPFLYIYQ